MDRSHELETPKRKGSEMELSDTIKWQSIGGMNRQGHVGDPYTGILHKKYGYRHKKYSYRYFITNRGKPPTRFVAHYKARIIGRFETLDTAKEACQRHWEGQPEHPEATPMEAETRIVDPVEKAGVKTAGVIIPCENTVELQWDRTDAELAEAGLLEDITKSEYDAVQEAFWTLVNVEKSIRDRRNLDALHFATAEQNDPYKLIGDALGRLARVKEGEKKDG